MCRKCPLVPKALNKSRTGTNDTVDYTEEKKEKKKKVKITN